MRKPYPSVLNPERMALQIQNRHAMWTAAALQQWKSMVST